MMRYITIIFSLLVFSVNGGCVVLNQNLNKKINISLSNKQYNVGASIFLEVVYTNNTTETLTFEDPEKIWEVQFLIKKADGSEKRASLGRLFYSKQKEIERTIVEEAEIISLEPSKSYSFNIDIGKRWTEFFTPGEHNLQIIDEADDNETIISNEIPIQIVFVENSFNNLAQIAGNEQYSNDSRKFSEKWVREFYPPFTISFDHTLEGQKNISNKNVSEALYWWQNEAKRSDIQDKIRQINSTGKIAN